MSCRNQGVLGGSVLGRGTTPGVQIVSKVSLVCTVLILPVALASPVTVGAIPVDSMSTHRDGID